MNEEKEEAPRPSREAMFWGAIIIIVWMMVLTFYIGREIGKRHVIRAVREHGQYRIDKRTFLYGRIRRMDVGAD